MFCKEIETPHELEKLIEELESLYKEGEHIFRGQPDARYRLIPNAFRESSLKKASTGYLAPDKIESWFSNKSISDFVNVWTKGYKSEKLDETVRRLLKFNLIIMQYNHMLFEYYQANSHYVNDTDRLIIDRFNAEHWLQEQTFVGLFRSSFPKLMTRISADGSVLQRSKFPKEITGVDETFPQHYDFPSAALDWSYDPFVAMHFAIPKDDEHFNSDKKLYTASKIRAKYVSIYAYKQLSNIENPPILIKNKCALKENLRANRQKGTFTYFNELGLFYLRNGMLPSIEHYNTDSYSGYEQKFFELTKFNICNNEANVSFLRHLLKKRGINKSFLLPEYEEVRKSKIN